MRKISAKIRLTLFTTILMLIMASVLIALMFIISDDIVLANSIDQLTEVIDDNSDELEFEKGELDTGDVDFFKKGVYTILYTQDGEYIKGDSPETDISKVSFNDKETTEFNLDETKYYIYDRLVPVEDSSSLVWMRGVIAVDEATDATSNILQIALLSMPFFIILGAAGCYFIAKITFRPIDNIIKTTQEIGESENLSLRINLQGGSPEMQKLAQTFDKMFERLEGTFEAEKQFTSDVSHELRTPTAVILAQCEYAIGKNITLEDKEDALETVQRQALKMSNLISDLLNLIRLDRGTQKAELRKINLSELIKEICEEQKLIADSYVKLTYDIKPDINGMFDEGMINRLLCNLLNNAFYYKKEIDDASVHITLNETDTQIILSVQDNGIGIAKEHQEKIWHRFYQVDSSRTKSQYGSMGLGLSMVAQIAKLHQAKILLESEVDKGSLFIIKFLK